MIKRLLLIGLAILALAGHIKAEGATTSGTESSESKKMCPICGHPMDECTCGTDNHTDADGDND